MILMERVCFTLRLRREPLHKYESRHEAVWLPMLREIALSGRRNYSLFLRKDGRLIGYCETDSDEVSAEYLRGSAIAAKWETDMRRFFTGVLSRAGQAAEQLPEVFNLETALALAESPA